VEGYWKIKYLFEIGQKKIFYIGINIIPFFFRENKIMILIKLQGGLGNQMFQYAIATIIANNTNSKVLIDNSFFNQVEKKQGFTPRNFELDIFDIYYKKATDSDILSFNNLSNLSKLKKKIGLKYPKIYQESSFNFQDEVLLMKSPLYLKGYFQSYKYFRNNEDLIRNIFSFPINLLDSINKDLLFELKKQNTIAVHIRRGDYV